MTEAEDEAVDVVDSLRERLGRVETGRPSGGPPAARRPASSASSGSIRRSPSATGCPSRSAGPAAGSCWATRASGPSRRRWDAVREVDPEVLVLMPCGFDLADGARRGERTPRPRPGPSCARSATGGSSRSTDRPISAGPARGSSTASSCWPSCSTPSGMRRQRPVDTWTRGRLAPRWLVPRDLRLPVVRHAPTRRAAGRPRGLGPAVPGRASARPATTAFLRFRLQVGAGRAPAALAGQPSAAVGGRRAGRRSRAVPARGPRRRRCRPTTRRAPPNTTTGTCAAGAIARGPVHDMAWKAELDCRDALARRAAARGPRSWSWPPGPAGGRRCSPARASCRSTTPTTGRSTAPGTGSWPTACAPTSTSRDAWAEPDRPVDALFCRLLAEPRAAAPARRVPGARPALAQAGRDVRVHRLAPRPPLRCRGPAGVRRGRGHQPTARRRPRVPGRQGLPAAGRARSRPAGGRLLVRRGRDHVALLPDGQRTGPGSLYSGAMSPLSNRTIATVGSGVMAEAMIAGLLRGQLVEPRQVTASHPRQERREELEREYGIRTVPGNTEAIEGADVILLADQAADAQPGRPRDPRAPPPRASSSCRSSPARRPPPSRASSAISGSSGACPTRRPASGGG